MDIFGQQTVMWRCFKCNRELHAASREELQSAGFSHIWEHEQMAMARMLPKELTAREVEQFDREFLEACGIET
jgi:hypothetical protein